MIKLLENNDKWIKVSHSYEYNKTEKFEESLTETDVTRDKELIKELKSFGVDKKGKVAKITVQLWPHLGDWRSTLVHELAHIAVYRWRAFMTKDYKKGSLSKSYHDENLRMSLIKEQLTMEDHHGPRFQKALLSLTKRALREFGEEIPEHDVFWNSLKFELESFMK